LTLSTAIEIVLEISPWKNEVENARQMQSRWFVALLLCNNWVLRCCLQEHIMLYCEKQQHQA
jgi:hypothetical protein